MYKHPWDLPESQELRSYRDKDRRELAHDILGLLAFASFTYFNVELSALMIRIGNILKAAIDLSFYAVLLFTVILPS